MSKIIKNKTGNVGVLEIRQDDAGLIFISKCETGFIFSDIARGELRLSWEEIENLIRSREENKK